MIGQGCMYTLWCQVHEGGADGTGAAVTRFLLHRGLPEVVQLCHEQHLANFSYFNSRMGIERI